MSKTKTLFIVSMILFVGWIGFCMIPSLELLGGGFGFFFIVMIFATIICFIKELRDKETQIIYIQNEKVKTNNEENVVTCKYCDCEIVTIEKKCSNCGANLKSKS